MYVSLAQVKNVKVNKTKSNVGTGYIYIRIWMCIFNLKIMKWMCCYHCCISTYIIVMWTIESGFSVFLLEDLSVFLCTFFCDYDV